MNGYYRASNFVNTVYKKLNKLKSNEYLLQAGTIKQLKEEQLPLACFVKKLERPGLEVKCKHILGSQNYDAKLKLNGYFVNQEVYKNEYYVEITNAIFNNEHKARISLANDGVYSSRQAYDIDYPIDQMIEKVKVAIDKKNEMNYPHNTILIINLISEKPLNIRTWEIIRNKIRIQNSLFLNILMVESYRNIVLEIFVNRLQGAQSFT